ncbi:MAG: DNA polymerase/3'-5' exonuclease PolX [Candidatus Hydrogenedentes bacterium]|nr:DNA polymerase/3'-5' exonuclease PolX [Candidatus Hydrogenedentota bacterium]
MNNTRIAKALHNIAVLLEIKGENPFKIRSYAQASQIIEKMDEPAKLLLQTGRLRSVDGIGKTMEIKIAEFVAKGEISYLNDLQELYPKTLLDLLKVDGVGPKSIRILFETLQIGSLDQLRQACVEGEITAIPGFTEKRKQKILDSLDFLNKQKGRFRLNGSWVLATTLCSRLLKHSATTTVEVAGSLRRFRDTVKDINLVAASSDAASVVKCFIEAPEVERVISVDHTQAAIIAKGGIPANLRVVTPPQFPYALLYFTGSKVHNKLLCQRASDHGMELNEYGLFKKDGTPLICKDEAAIYKAQDMPFLPPEVREGIFEFTLTDPVNLVKRSDIQGLVHCHSTWSDGINSLTEMANTARDLGYKYFVATDHSQSSTLVHGLSPERVLKQHKEIDEMNAKDLSGFRILKGIESDILPDGSLDYDSNLLRTFEFVIASIHSNFDMTEKEATWRIIRAIENPFTSAIGHLTGRLLLTRRGYSVDVEKVVDAAIANGVAFEINANPRRLDMDWRHLRRAAEKGARFSIGPDAHRLIGLHNVRYGVGIARKGALTPSHILNCLPVEKFLQWRKS